MACQSSFLRRMVGLSFVLGTLALTWYASDMHRSMSRMHHGRHGHHNGHPNNSNKQSSGQVTLNNNTRVNETNNTNANITVMGSSVLAVQNQTREQQQQQQNNEVKNDDDPDQTAWWAATTKTIYALGVSWWILTGFLAYFGPLLRPRFLGNQIQNSVGNWNSHSQPRPCWNFPSIQRIFGCNGDDVGRRIVFWCLVMGPSLWVYFYATLLGLPGAKQDVLGEGSEDDSPVSVLEWMEIWVWASALPSGTAGMMSMGIYVFGTVAKHSPLWSAYVVLPASNNNNSNNSHCHTNLMKDALRLHQWAGYVTFGWFLFHTLLYCLVYGFAGLRQHLEDEASEASSSLTTVSNLTTINSTAVNATTALEGTEVTSSSSPSAAMIFLGSVWNALVPPPKCRPILGWWGNASKSPGEESTPQGRRRQEFVNGLDDLYHRSRLEEVEADCFSGNFTFHENQTQSGNLSSLCFNTTEDPREQEEQQQEKQEHPPCYGYYRNFNGFLAILALVALVLTSITAVRRANYRFFYVSHLVTATIFVIAMVLHMKRIIVYLLPSLVCYFATTIPTWIQSWVGAVLDGGVRLEDFTVLKASGNVSDAGGNDGVVEFTVLVDASAGEAVEACANHQANHRISHRPKSVRICVPSISSLWYPFTVIEPVTKDADSITAANRTSGEEAKPVGLVEYKVIFGTVGYFTKSLWKRLYEIQQQQQQQQLEQNHAEGGDAENGLVENDENGIEEDFFEDEAQPSRYRGRNQRQQDGLPLILVDGFYSGTSDWIENARHHDVLLIAAGGTGVTPFLTFVPKLLQVMRLRLSQAQTQPAECTVEEGNRIPTSISFLWCCRDEALIQHVVTNYLLPLLQTRLEKQDPQKPQATFRFRIMIYNTSRERGDATPLEFSCSNKSRWNCRNNSLTKGRAMNPSRLQHHPFSSRARAVTGAVTFLSIGLMGVGIHLWANGTVLGNRFRFAVRLYGLGAIVVWTCLVGILVCRVGSAWSLRHIRTGYAIASKNDHESSFTTTTASVSSSKSSSHASMEDTFREPKRGLPGPILLEPGQIYSEQVMDGRASCNPVLEVSLLHGRPILGGETGESEDDDNRTCEKKIPSPSEHTLLEVIAADRPGVFYCGPDGLLDAIKTRVSSGRNQRQRLCDSGSAGFAMVDCTFYEESFEM